MFFVDRDGKTVLDFFGESSRAPVPDERAREWARKAWDFVRQSHDKHRATGNDTIAAKYVLA